MKATRIVDKAALLSRACSLTDLAIYFGVSRATMRKWIENTPEYRARKEEKRTLFTPKEVERLLGMFDIE